MFWSSLYTAINPYEYDFPTAILYSHCEVGTRDSTGSINGHVGQCILEWTIGYTAGHPAIPKSLNLGDDHAFARAMSESEKEGFAKLYRKEEGALPVALFEEGKRRAFGDPCKALIIIPIRRYDAIISGYLIVGLNTRRPYDVEYQDWIEVLSNLLGASAASVAHLEEATRSRRRQEVQATKDREALSAEVAVLSLEASHAAEKLRNFYDIANAINLGYFECDVSGRLMHANLSIY
jgi:hypothetical protein